MAFKPQFRRSYLMKLFKVQTSRILEFSLSSRLSGRPGVLGRPEWGWARAQRDPRFAPVGAGGQDSPSPLPPLPPPHTHRAQHRSEKSGDHDHASFPPEWFILLFV